MNTPQLRGLKVREPREEGVGDVGASMNTPQIRILKSHSEFREQNRGEYHESV